MKVCENGIDVVQIINAHGDIRQCSWNTNSVIGSLLEDDYATIITGERAQCFRKPLFEQTYTDCPVDNCPYLANNTIEEHLIDVEEIPLHLKELYLAYEGRCNYNCTCCSSHDNMKDTREHDYSKNYDKIYEKIKPMLPYVRKISAHGRGELFASPHIMKVLSEWEPQLPADEISVSLETNGSLFNEQNWKKIENLGKYNLTVAITVMSFNEEVYQYLSGTKLPVSNIINNLKFVKKLRESGIINEIELATVLQEQNFREMPEFTRRCIEEFGADIVRIRPIMPGGRLDPVIQWFMDVRNPHHPYYKDYKKVMSHPIFKDPKVLLWSGDLDSTYFQEKPWRTSDITPKEQKIFQIMSRIVEDKDFVANLNKKIREMNCANLSVYGMGRVGKLVTTLADDSSNIEINELYDAYAKGTYRNYSIKTIEDREVCDKIYSDLIVITLVEGTDEITELIKSKDCEAKVLTIEQLLEDVM